MCGKSRHGCDSAHALLKANYRLKQSLPQNFVITVWQYKDY